MNERKELELPISILYESGNNNNSMIVQHHFLLILETERHSIRRGYSIRAEKSIIVAFFTQT